MSEKALSELLAIMKGFGWGLPGNLSGKNNCERLSPIAKSVSAGHRRELWKADLQDIIFFCVLLLTCYNIN